MDRVLLLGTLASDFNQTISNAGPQGIVTKTPHGHVAFSLKFAAFGDVSCLTGFVAGCASERSR